MGAWAHVSGVACVEGGGEQRIDFGLVARQRIGFLVWKNDCEAIVVFGCLGLCFLVEEIAEGFSQVQSLCDGIEGGCSGHGLPDGALLGSADVGGDGFDLFGVHDAVSLMRMSRQMGLEASEHVWVVFPVTLKRGQRVSEKGREVCRVPMGTVDWQTLGCCPATQQHKGCQVSVVFQFEFIISLFY